jgi:LacI family transcriptional regulator, galactose operon repressor
MTVRMKDIAADLGISIVTVSKVLNNHHDISEVTRARVLRRIKELNYRPNLHARGLASGQSFMIGLIVPDLVHAFFSEVAQNLAGTIRRKGFGLMIASSNEDAAFEREEIELMIRRRVDVLIVASCQSNASHLRKAAEEVPLILLDRRFDDFEGNFVGTDDLLVGRLATEHLLQMGYCRVAHIGGQKTSTSYGRLQGYRDTLTGHQLAIRESYIVCRKRADVGGDVSGRQAMEKLLLLKPLPDAVFCYNDPAAIGAITAIISAGLSIPGDIAIVGAGNIRYAESLRVPLSSVDVSSAALGEHAGKLAVELTLKKRKVRPQTILVRPKLIIRDSSTPLRERASG